jgi:hypothetical protein
MSSKKINPFFIGIAALAVLLALTYCSYRSSSEPRPTKVNAAVTQTDSSPVIKQISPADKIGLHAYAEYKKEDYPDLFDQVGEDGLKNIFQHDMDSAYKVAARDDCDRVEYSAYSKEMSNYPNKIVSFVDCKNGSRFYVSGEVIEKR